MVVGIAPAHVGSSPHEQRKKNGMSKKKGQQFMHMCSCFASPFILGCSFAICQLCSWSYVHISICLFVNGPGLAHLIRLQCDLYSDFAAKYRSHPDLPMLRRRHFSQVARFLCRAGFPPGWANVWALVLRQEPLAPIWAGLEVLRALGRRISSLGPRMSWKNAVEHQ